MLTFALLLFDFAVVCLVLRALAPRLAIDGASKWIGPLARREGTTRGARPLLVLACMAATYVTTVALFTVGIHRNGELVYEPRIKVGSGTPAEAAGLHTGDTVISVDGAPIAKFEDISPALQAAKTDRVDVRVARDGAELVVPVTPRIENGTRRIGVTAASAGPTSRDIGLGRAIARGAVAPIAFVKQRIGDATRDTPDIKAFMAASTPLPGDFWIFLGGSKTTVWPATVLLSLFLVFRRGRAPAAPAPASKA